MSAYNEVTPSKKTAANFGTTEVLYVGQIDPTLLLKMLDEVQVLKNLRAEMLILKVYQNSSSKCTRTQCRSTLYSNSCISRTSNNVTTRPISE